MAYLRWYYIWIYAVLYDIFQRHTQVYHENDKSKALQANTKVLSIIKHDYKYKRTDTTNYTDIVMAYLRWYCIWVYAVLYDIYFNDIHKYIMRTIKERLRLQANTTVLSITKHDYNYKNSYQRDKLH